ncbi:hypothetical protein HK096_004030 [Nowakowskiella sp. JEL0078]|nr:hypothetical protein HK096_004030 [Nowakowskiella sp. JEL0078]
MDLLDTSLSLCEFPEHVLEEIILYLENPTFLISSCSLFHSLFGLSAVRYSWLLQRKKLPILLHNDVFPWLYNHTRNARDLKSLIAAQSEDDKLQIRMRPLKLNFPCVRLFNNILCKSIINRATPNIFKTLPITMSFESSFSNLSISRTSKQSPSQNTRSILIICAILISIVEGYEETLEPAFRGWDSFDLENEDPNTHDFFITNFFCAIGYGQLKIVKLFVDFFERKNWRLWKFWNYSDYFGPVHYAAITNRPEIIGLLVKSGCSPNGEMFAITGQTSAIITPLHLAIRINSLDNVDALLKNGADPMIKSEGLNSIQYACKLGYAHILTQIINNQRHNLSSILDRPSDEGQTALHYASHAGSIECVRILCRKGANINARDNQGTTPLFRSLEGTARKVNVAMCLIDEFGVDVHIADNEGWTAAHYAARWGYKRIMKRLLEAKVNCDAADIDGWSVLHCACKGGNVDIVKMLIAEGANVQSLDVEEWGCMHFAADSSEDPVEIIDILLSADVDPSNISKSGLTALHLVCRWGFFESCAHILQSGSPPSVPDNLGRTPLHLAAKGGNINCIKVLAPFANVNCKDNDGQTPFHYCSYATLDEDDMKEIVSVFLEFGADSNIIDNNSNTPFQLILRQKYVSVILFMIQNGADFRKVDSEGNNVLHFIAQSHFNPTDDLFDLVSTYGVDLINQRNNLQYTPLHLVIIEKFAKTQEILNMFLKIPGLKINIPGYLGRTALHLSMIYRLSEVAVMLLNEGADPSIQDSKGKVASEMNPQIFTSDLENDDNDDEVEDLDDAILLDNLAELLGVGN